MLNDLAVSASRHSDLYGMLFVLLIVLITSGRWRRGGFGPGGPGGGGWREQKRERMEKSQDERRQFQQQVLDELRRQREATEKQNELLARLVGGPPDGGETFPGHK